jgi:hypothetical protein
MPNTFPLVQASAQFAKILRANSLATRVITNDVDGPAVGFGDTVNVRFSVPQTPVAITPGHLPTAAQDVAPTSVAVVVDQFFERSMAVTDKEATEIQAGYVPMEMEQMGADLANQMNTFIYRRLIEGSSRAFGTAGTNPFATTEDTYLDAMQYLIEQLAPMGQTVGVLRPDAWRRAIQVPNLVQADRRSTAGSPLVTGNLDMSYGAPLAVDQLVPTRATAALGAGALTANGVNALGATTVSIAKGAGANVILVAGDVLTIAGHAGSYVVATGVTVTAGANTAVVLNSGLLQATAGGEVVTLIGAGTSVRHNPLFSRSAMAFASRPLTELSIGGRMGAEVFNYSDPLTGIVIRAEIERQNYQTKLKFAVLYGGRVIRPNLVTTLLG